MIDMFELRQLCLNYHFFVDDMRMCMLLQPGLGLDYFGLRDVSQTNLGGWWWTDWSWTWTDKIKLIWVVSSTQQQSAKFSVTQFTPADYVSQRAWFQCHRCWWHCAWQPACKCYVLPCSDGWNGWYWDKMVEMQSCGLLSVKSLTVWPHFANSALLLLSSSMREVFSSCRHWVEMNPLHWFSGSDEHCSVLLLHLCDYGTV